MTSPRRQHGFALLVVIWTVALLAVVAVAFSGVANRGVRIAHNLIEAARARTLADSAVSLAVLGILDPDIATRWGVTGETRRLELAGGSAQVTLQDEGGKVDLNEAEAPVITKLFAELGGSDAAVSTLLARRDAARARLAKGADFSEDLSDAPFRSIEALGGLPGIKAETLARLRPFVTVYSQNARINPLTAPIQVLNAVPGMTPDLAQSMLAARTSSEPLPRLGDVQRYVRPSDLRAVGVRAVARTDGGAVFERRAVVGLSRSPAQPYSLLVWN